MKLIALVRHLAFAAPASAASAGAPGASLPLTLTRKPAPPTAACGR